MSTETQTPNDLHGEVVETCLQYLRQYRADDVALLAQRYPNDERSLVIDWRELFSYDSGLAWDVLDHPQLLRRHFQQALAQYDLPVPTDLSDAHIRFCNLGDEETYDVGEYDSSTMGNLIGLKGQVTQLSASKAMLEVAVFECQRCGTETSVPQSGSKMQEPHECAGCERSGPFQIDIDQSEFVDHQVARIQLPPEKSSGGQDHIDVHLEDDLAGEVLKGNERVEIAGKLGIDTDDVDSRDFDYRMSTEEGFVEVEDGGYGDVDIDEHRDEIEKIADMDDPVRYLADSIAPHLATDSHFDAITEALVLQMMGAGRKALDDGTVIRGDSHVLLLGDPGTAKSELLEAVDDLTPRSKKASGKSLSKAGMTAAAVRDDFGPGEWSLKAGLMVLANEGTAIIDEIDKVDDETLDAAHQALENQQVSFVKAGIDAELPARTTVLAAGNPLHGRFDMQQSIADQIDLPPALMSRFDLMFMLQDTPDPERDEEIADAVVDSWDDISNAVYETGDGSMDDVGRDVPEDTFRAYVAYARDNIFPIIKDDAVKQQLKDQWMNLRSEGDDDNSAVPVTARKLQAMLRFSEASARTRLSETIEAEDVERAVRLTLTSMQDVGIDPETGEFDVDIVESGTTKSQRDRIRNLLGIITELEAEYEDGAPIETVLDRCESTNIGRSTGEHEIQNLKDRGEIYEHKPGHLRTS